MTATPLYVDVSALLPRHLTGIGRFICRLVQELAARHPLRLAAILDRDTIGRWNAPQHLCDRDIPLTAATVPQTTDLRAWADELLALPTVPSSPAHRRRCPGVFTYLRPDVRLFRREVAVVYDFTPVLQPQFQDENTRKSFASSFQCLPLSDAVVAISEATRRDALFLTGVRPDAVFAHHPGPSQCVRAHAHPHPVARRDDLVLVVATLEPRKNARFVLDWFLGSPAMAGKRLCWVGPPGWLPALGDKPPTSDRVVFPGVVSDAELCRLYQEATFAVYPSLYEGFGFPVLDALRHGCPVAASYNSSLVEFDGPGVFYFDPGDPQTLEDACQSLRTTRADHRIDVPALDRRFSWGALAEAVLGHAGCGSLACAS